MTRLSNWLLLLAAAGLLMTTAIIGWQVFGRFILASSPSWTEQAALVLMIWFVLLGAAAGVHEQFHIRIDLLQEKLGRSRRSVEQIGSAVVLAMGGLLLLSGLELCWAVRGNTIPSLGISRAAAYAPLPLSGLFIILFSARQIFAGRPHNPANMGTD